LAITFDAKWHDITGVSVRGEQVGELDFAVERVDVVSVLIDFIVRDRSHDVADLESGFHCWRARLDVGDINSSRVLALFSRKLTQRRITCGEEREASGRKSTIILGFGVL